ncbi:catechol 1,2-dioxygenase [Pseudoxanthomonas winnipegensis]|uniref:catechol 1,2-dioxygenase n=1 Tax=Pseudoxanthomonas winnipegensis TaxID=2480810 RepID=A0A4Q8LL27_9GAMM|nr:catechol 1,2-dioxygenase [Pseudoxanthomonas winnipegensis]RZZ86092.1 catechol 1,2-dioxygenase [Pseudoxanthomonas winnipegensis]TAA31229.1 catechol 1,2-dioxygenase [Pseudoxanthomonas winnipegensis]TBV77467.1 catechol 1,2-dioxygenase [Pseudoxanthomonas winnipegensis]
MSVSIFASQDVQDFLRTVANLDGQDGDARTKQVLHRILSDLFKAIEDLDLTPDEIWAGINYLNKLGQDNEAALLAAGIGLEHYIDMRLDEEDRLAGISGGTPRTIEGPLYVAGAPVTVRSARIDRDPDPDAGPLRIHGVVRGQDGAPLAGALVECWHANSKGFYSHFDPTGAQTEFNLRGTVKTGPDGRYEFLTRMPVGYGCPPQGATQQLLDRLARHGNRPAHVHFFVSGDDHRRLTTQFNIDGDPLLWDDFAFAKRDGLVPPVKTGEGGKALGFEAETYQDIEFDFDLLPLEAGKDVQAVHRLRAAA